MNKENDQTKKKGNQGSKAVKEQVEEESIIEIQGLLSEMLKQDGSTNPKKRSRVKFDSGIKEDESCGIEESKRHD